MLEFVHLVAVPSVSWIILFAATFCTGVMAGVFFIWSNTVKPGLGKMTDDVYLRTFQALNKVILNPGFFFFFIGSTLLCITSLVLHWNSATAYQAELIGAGAVAYGIGVFFVTAAGNVPINNRLERADLDAMSSEQKATLRSSIEGPWNRLNRIRTIFNLIAFGSLLTACLI